MERVSRKRRCPKCGHPDWCLIAPDGSAGICQRVKSQKRCGEAGFLHILTKDTATRPGGRPPAEPPPTNPSSPAAPNPDWAARARAYSANLTAARKARLAAELDVPVEALDESPLVGVNPDEPGHGCYTFVEQNADGHITALLRRWPKGKSPHAKDKMVMTGGRRGLSVPVEWRARSGPRNLVEGPTDTLCLAFAGLSALGRPNNRCGADLLADLLRDDGDRPAYVWGENDEKADGTWPGREGADEVAAQLARRLGRRVFKVLPPPDYKDVRDYLTAPIWEGADWPARGKALLAYAEVAAVPVDPPPDPPLFASAGEEPPREPPAAEGGGDPPPEPSPEPLYDPHDPHVLADGFAPAGAGGEGLRTLRYWRGEFVRWSAAAYRPDPDDDVRARLTEFIRNRFDLDAREIIVINHAEGLTEPVTVRQVPTVLVGNVLNALRGRCLLPADIVRPAWIDGSRPADPRRVLAAANGLVDLEGAAARRADCLTPRTPAFFTLNAVPYAFDLHAPAPAEWLKFLSLLWPDDPDSIACLQEWFGLLLAADTSFQKILLIVGPPRAGKGTVGRVLRELVGRRNVGGPTLSSLGENFCLAPLLDKPVAIIDDARISGRTDAAVVTERLLTISGEGELTVDRKFLSQVTTQLPTRFLILSNEMPRLSDASGALAGRFVVLRLTRSWKGKEDRALAGRLCRELPGILLWSVEGWRRLQERERFTQPASGAELLSDLRNLTSPIGQVVRERCVVEPAAEVAIAVLYRAWESWCRVQGESRPGTVQAAGQLIRAAAPDIKRSRPEGAGKRPRTYQGIRLRTDIDPEPEE
jgi:putative DNA primase/helicase